MTYWVYENIPLRRTRVHLGSCSFCRDGYGIHGGGKRPTGAWFGPFLTLREAQELAASRKRLDNQRCQECLPTSEEEATEDDATMEATVLSPLKSPDAYSWDKEEELRCSLSLRWKPIGRVLLDETGKLRFPTMPEGPGLYRLRLRTSDGIESNYVGQSDSLRRRFFHYRNPGPTQPTNIRLNQLIRDLLSGGGEVSVATAHEVWVQAEQGVARADLNRGSLRRLFENLALAVEQASDIDSLNR